MTLRPVSTFAPTGRTVEGHAREDRHASCSAEPTEHPAPCRGRARRLGVHPNTLAGWVKRGWLTGVTMPSGEVRFREADVEALRERIYAE